MSLPYFPMFPADFDADTGHLTLAEDGAYNRLLRLQWRAPGCKLPGDMEWVFRKAKAATDDDRKVVETIIAEFFTRKGGKIYNARLLKEYVKSDVAHSKRVAAGSKGGSVKSLKTNKSASSNATALPKQPEPEPEPYKEGGGGGSAGGRETPILPDHDPTFRECILSAMGLGPDGVAGPSKFVGGQGDMAEAARWLALPGLTEEAVIAEVARLSAAKADGPANSFRYFTPAMQRLSADLTATPLQPAAPPPARASPRPGQPDLAAAIARLEAQGRI